MVNSDKSNLRTDYYSQWYINKYATSTKLHIGEQTDIECATGKRLMSVAIPRGIACYMYADCAARNNHVKSGKEIRLGV